MSEEPETPPPETKPCRWCGELHGPLCPMVKALEFDKETEKVTRVEFLTAADMIAPHGSNYGAEPDEAGYEYARLKPMGASNGAKNNSGEGS
jgi:hypothetical protein